MTFFFFPKLRHSAHDFRLLCPLGPAVITKAWKFFPDNGTYSFLHGCRLQSLLIVDDFHGLSEKWAAERGSRGHRDGTVLHLDVGSEGLRQR